MNVVIAIVLVVAVWFGLPFVVFPALKRRWGESDPDAAEIPKPAWFWPVIGTMCTAAVVGFSWDWDAGRPDPVSLVLCAAAAGAVWIRWARRR